MNFAIVLSDSFVHAKDAIAGTRMELLLPVVVAILLCIPLPGYTLKV